MKRSAGILLYRITYAAPEFLLVHPGGPFFVKKNEGWWTLPKGEPQSGEGLFACALREFTEETGYTPQPPFKALQSIQQKGGKMVYCWAAEGNFNPEDISCNTFDMEWPPKSGIIRSFPEIDRAGWFAYADAKVLINERQVAFLDEVLLMLA